MPLSITYDELPPLVEYCDCVYWDGRRERYDPDTDSDVPCSLCNDGERPTEFGLAVLDLVKRFGWRERWRTP